MKLPSDPVESKEKNKERKIKSYSKNNRKTNLNPNLKKQYILKLKNNNEMNINFDDINEKDFSNSFIKELNILLNDDDNNNKNILNETNN